jgi:hypothetical protein
MFGWIWGVELIVHSSRPRRLADLRDKAEKKGGKS